MSTKKIMRERFKFEQGCIDNNLLKSIIYQLSDIEADIEKIRGFTDTNMPRIYTNNETNEIKVDPIQPIRLEDGSLLMYKLEVQLFRPDYVDQKQYNEHLEKHLSEGAGKPEAQIIAMQDALSNEIAKYLMKEHNIKQLID